MYKKFLKLRNVATIVACLAVTTMFSSCKSGDKNGNDPNGNGATVAITLDLMKGAGDNEIIVKCTPACPWVQTGLPACYFNRQGLFYNATKTGGTATEIFADMNSEGAGWNTAGTEYTYVFDCMTGDWQGTVTLAPVDQQHLKDIGIANEGVKSITIGKNDPVILKLGH